MWTMAQGPEWTGVGSRMDAICFCASNALRAYPGVRNPSSHEHLAGSARTTAQTAE